MFIFTDVEIPSEKSLLITRVKIVQDCLSGIITNALPRLFSGFNTLFGSPSVRIVEKTSILVKFYESIFLVSLKIRKQKESVNYKYFISCQLRKYVEPYDGSLENFILPGLDAYGSHWRNLEIALYIDGNGNVFRSHDPDAKAMMRAELEWVELVAEKIVENDVD